MNPANMVVLNRKTIAKMGASMGEGAGSKPSAFALKQMEKMGWTEGQGLGKDGDGIKTHIKIKKREDATGLGAEKIDEPAMGADNWWHDAFSSSAKIFKHAGSSEKEKKKKEKKEKKTAKKKKLINGGNEDDELDNAAPTYEELFAATGGARLGMRARADQTGKLKRTEVADSIFIKAITTQGGATAYNTSSSTVTDDMDAPSAIEKKKSKKQRVQ
jgi:Pin2-interacting protein X1